MVRYKKPPNKAPLCGIPFEYAVFDVHTAFAALTGVTIPKGLLREHKPLSNPAP